MQTCTGSCSPERLRMLQQVFDSIWFEVAARSRRPSEALRTEIARLVMGHLEDAAPQPGEIAKAIFSMLSVEILRDPPPGSRAGLSRECVEAK